MTDTTGGRCEAKPIRLSGLWKIFSTRREQVTAVRDVSLTVEPGELLTLLGPSGCGKTTVLRMIAGLEDPTQGDIQIGEVRVNDLPANRRRVGMVFQNYALFPHLTVFENAAYALRIRRRPEGEIQEAVRSILRLLGIEGHAGRLPARLSGGEQQRVALARALVSRPDVLLFDEPLSNLDAKLRLQVRGEIRRIQRTLGITAVYVTHDQSEAMSLADRIAIMQAGQLVQVGRPQEIYRRPATEFVADFVGRANVFPGRVRARGPLSVAVEFLGGTVEVASWSGNPQPGDRVCLVIRPEAVRLVPPGEGTARGIIRRTDYQGAVAECQIEADGCMLLGVVDQGEEAALPSEGMPVGLRFRKNGLHAIAAPETAGGEPA
jgi:iron(III) transport system ATP-binding protein